MKLTATQLRRIIKEEVQNHKKLTEGLAGMSRTSIVKRVKDWTGEDVDLEAVDAVIETLINDTDAWAALVAERNEMRRERGSM